MISVGPNRSDSVVWRVQDLPKAEEFLNWQIEWLGQDNILRKTNLGGTSSLDKP